MIPSVVMSKSALFCFTEKFAKWTENLQNIEKSAKMHLSHDFFISRVFFCCPRLFMLFMSLFRCTFFLTLNKFSRCDFHKTIHQWQNAEIHCVTNSSQIMLIYAKHWKMVTSWKTKCNFLPSDCSEWDYKLFLDKENKNRQKTRAIMGSNIKRFEGDSLVSFHPSPSLIHIRKSFIKIAFIQISSPFLPVPIVFIKIRSLYSDYNSTKITIPS